MLFLLLLAVVTLAIAGVAAFFSVLGLATMFSGAYWEVVIMGGVLEAGKLMAASFVYRYWHVLNILMRLYLILAIFVLMIITSIGIYGKLSAAHQQDMIPLQEIQTKLELLSEEKTRIANRKEEMDQQITNMPANYITARQRLMKSFAPELDKINARLEKIQAEEYRLRNMEIQQKVHTGPIIFIAKAFNYPIENAMSYLIIAIMVAFDPLAVVLTLGLNIALVKRKEEKIKVVIEDEIIPNDQLTAEDIDNEKINELLEQLKAAQQNDSADVIAELQRKIAELSTPQTNEELDRLALRQKIKADLRKKNGKSTVAS